MYVLQGQMSISGVLCTQLQLFQSLAHVEKRCPMIRFYQYLNKI